MLETLEEHDRPPAVSDGIPGLLPEDRERYERALAESGDVALGPEGMNLVETPLGVVP